MSHPFPERCAHHFPFRSFLLSPPFHSTRSHRSLLFGIIGITLLTALCGWGLARAEETSDSTTSVPIAKTIITPAPDETTMTTDPAPKEITPPQVTSPSADPVPEARRLIEKEGLYREAFDLLAPWLKDPKTEAPSMPIAIDLCSDALINLNETPQLDSFLEEVLSTHPENWRVRRAIAQRYQIIPHWGTLLGGLFSRGTGTNQVNAEERDRIRALQIMAETLPIIEKGLSESKISPKEASEFYLSFSSFFDPSSEWTILTDLTRLPDYSETPSYVFWRNQDRPPVNEAGEPIYCELPESFDSAKNDGERWRFLLDRAGEIDPANRLSVMIRYAAFLAAQFSPASLLYSGIVPPSRQGEEEGDGGEDSNPLGAWSLPSLSDDETITVMADRSVKRLTLPEDHNYIRIYQRVLASEPSGDAEANPYSPHQANRRRAANELGREYLNRGQFLKAEEAFLKLAELEKGLKEEEKSAKQILEEITGNYGAFENTTAGIAGMETSFVWRFRNGKNVRFLVNEIDVPLLLDDLKATLHDYVNNPPKEWDRQDFNLEDLGWRILNDPKKNQKYLKRLVADWSVELTPEPDHRDSRVSVPFPTDKAGAYLIRGKMENGNSDAIILWLNDTAIVKKSLDGKTLWFVADAATGEPLPGIDLQFFGYSRSRKSANEKTKEEKPGEKSPFVWRTKEFTLTTDDEGLGTITPSDPKSGGENGQNNMNWLVEVRTPDSGETPRFAFYGFDHFWQSRRDLPFTPNRTKVFFLSDRPVYRPGQPVHFKFRLGSSDYAQPDEWTGAGEKMTLQIYDPANALLSEKEVTLDETGSFEDILETDPDFKLGVYRFLLQPQEKSRLKRNQFSGTGSGLIRLEEYKKPEFEVTVSGPEAPITLGDSFKATIHADYYFGSPVTRGKVHYQVQRTSASEDWFPVRPWDWLYGNGYGWLAPDAPWFPGWRHWGIPGPRGHFYPSHRFSPPEVVLEGETELDEEGKAEIVIDSSLAAKIYPNEDQRYEITATVTDQSRRSISSTKNVLAAKKPFKVYVWADKGFYAQNQQVTLFVQARRIDGQPVAGEALFTVARVHYEKDLEDPTKISPSESVVFSEKRNVGEDGRGICSLTLTESGQYHVSCVVTTPEEKIEEGGTLLSIYGQRFGFRGEETTSNGPQAGPSDPSEDSKPDLFQSNPLDLIPEKAEYKPGETVRLSLNTRRKNGTVLLFLRSEGNTGGQPILTRTNNGRAIYEFNLTEGDQPNIFVEALTIDNGHLYHAEREIAVPPEKRVLNVEVTPEKKDYRPGEEGTIKVRVTGPDGSPVTGEVVAAIYDRSVEAISGGSNIPDLKNFFWNWKRSMNPLFNSTLEKVFSPIDFLNKKWMTPLGMEMAGIRFFGTNGIRAEEDGMIDGAMNERKELKFGKSTNSVAAPLMALGAMAPGAAEETTEDSVGFDKMENEAARAFDAESGGGASPAPEEGVEPEIRKDFADTALWVGRLELTSDGTADISLTMPENLTAWKIRVWSFAPGTRVGEGSSEVVTRKNLILRAQRPRFLTQTDQVLLSANVHNYLSSEKNVTISLAIDPEREEGKAAGESAESSDPLTLIEGPATRTVTIPAGGEVRVDWLVEARGAEDVPFVMTARSNEESDGMRETIPIQLHGITKQVAVSGLIPAQKSRDEEDATSNAANRTEEVTFEMTVPEDRIPDVTKLTVGVSPTLAGTMIDALPFLTSYPYGCSEQTLNRFLPTVLVQKLLTDLGVDLPSLAEKRSNLNPQELGDPDQRRKEWNTRRTVFGDPITNGNDPATNPVYDPKEVAKRVAEGVERLSDIQCSDGGWGWFGGDGEHSDPHLTALIVEGLRLARDSGAEVPANLIERGENWLKDYLVAETVKLENGEKWSDEAKKEAPRQWKSTVDDEDVLVYRVLTGSKSMDAMESENAEFQRTFPIMKDFIWRDRSKITLYSLALYGLTLTESETERLEGVLRILRQYLKTDEANQTAWLDLAGASRGGWRWWSWSGDDIETEAAFLRLLVRANPDDEIAPRLVKYLLNNRKNATYWKSTRDTAACLVAFVDYIKATGEGSSTQTVEILIDGVEKKRIEITPETLFAIDNVLELPDAELGAGVHRVTIRKTGGGPLYYNAYLSYFTLENFITATGQEVGVERKYWKVTEDASATKTVLGGRGEAIDQRVQRQVRTPLELDAELESGDLIEVELLITTKNDYESLLIQDRKPAGFEPVETRSGYNGNELGAYAEFRDNRVCFFVHRLHRGDYSLTYRLRAETPGKVSALPANIEGIYAPELKGNSDEFKVRVIDKE